MMDYEDDFDDPVEEPDYLAVVRKESKDSTLNRTNDLSASRNQAGAQSVCVSPAGPIRASEIGLMSAAKTALQTDAKRLLPSNDDQDSSLIYDVKHKKTSPSVACDTSDFRSTVDVQTEEESGSVSWTQAPAFDAAEEAGRVVDSRIFSVSTNPQKTRKSVDFVRCAEFVQRAGNLIFRMLDEERYRKNVRKTALNNSKALLISQNQLNFHVTPALKQCAIKYVRACKGTFPLFLICYVPLKENVLSVGFAGFVSGWNGYAVTEPCFILATFGIPTCSVALLEDGQFVVAGHADGSVSCWDTHYIPGQNRDEKPMDFFQPSFVSCSTVDKNHACSVVDMTVIGSKRPADRKENRIGSCASIDETGVIITWNAILVDSSSWSSDATTGGLAPGSSVILISLRRITTWKAGSLSASRIYADPLDPLVFFVYANTGSLHRVHRDGNSLKPVIYVSATGVSCCVPVLSFSPFYQNCFLMADSEGNVRLYNKNYAKELLFWHITDRQIVSVYWSAVNPWIFYTVDISGCIFLVDLWTKTLHSPMITSETIGSGGELGSGPWKSAEQQDRHILFWSSQRSPVVVVLNETLELPNQDQRARGPFESFESPLSVQTGSINGV